MEIFAEALETPEAERRTFLERCCGGDAELLARVESLLLANAKGQPLFETGELQERIRRVLAQAAEGSPEDHPPAAVEVRSTERANGLQSTRETRSAERGQVLSHYRLVERIGSAGTSRRPRAPGRGIISSAAGSA